MSSDEDLKALLSTMAPNLTEGEFVFCSLDEDEFARLRAQPVATFRETEGISVVIPKRNAESEGLRYSFVAKMIKLGVYSSLDAVGLIAAVAGKLAQTGISVNPVSAFFHDYLFVPVDRAEDAMAALETLIRDSA